MIPKELFKKIRQIEIRTKGLVSNIFGGEYHSAFKGTGMDFAEVRPYQFGDDVRNIDWNVSARYPETFIKVFEEEREQTLLLAVDVSGSEDFASSGQFKREMAAEICAVVAFSAIQNNDKVGLLLFSDQVELFVPPKKGKKHVLRLIRDLFAHQTKSSGTNIKIALDHMVHVLHRRSIVMVLSDFMDDGFENSLRAVSRRHDTIAVHMIDPVELDLPDVGLLEITDAETGQQILVDTSSMHVRDLYAEQAEIRTRNVQTIFRKLRVDRVPIHTDIGYLDPLIRFFRKRNKLN
ncbi:MAG: DUF58 domain-containing protein [Bacteroidetes Order II. Incertae sedis bacterium]|jgi:uncharacterized protein (DUF58 family)|nr:DUF58 domain-containing protein [Bacteroidetes Order II. bacterium]HAY36733.1 DUF58 domain-containing protein [Bacteroidota bacterium]MBT4052240.1 DUF58 domain-containing protein [Bacteroidetes Order II. bacterium]MBT4603096.1 DUF58 domain-containing protein [Bacteroidetes Order II. bacterium]MBT5248754.1 DUF58 domain-containing protein [Bacteroidetes Order II. bacterium]